MSPGLLDWLLDSDPALRWQVERDLAGADESTWRATRSRVATEGFGAELLAKQDPDGQWAGGAYFPSEQLRESDQRGQPFTATTWSLNALREWGLDAAELDGTAELLARNCRWEYDGLPYWQGEVDACIKGYTLANGLWLGADVAGIATWFAERQLADGGWNCEWVDGSTRSSFDSTLNALGGLLAYEIASGDPAVAAVRRAGEEYLLTRNLLRRQSTGELVGPWVDTWAYPFRWPYSALRAVDYFREAALHDGTRPDPRIGEAVELIRGNRQADGRFLLKSRHPGAVWFEVDVAPGEPSKWLTFYATRALAWADG